MTRPEERLDSWKEIADYLGRDRTTVMRWERTAGFPVHRVAGERGRSVFAFKAEIDQWLQARPSLPEEVPPENAPPSPARRHLERGIAAALALAVCALFLLQASARGTVATVAMAGRELVASDSSGAEVWRLPLPLVDGNVGAARTLVDDLDGDGRTEVLAAVHYMPHGRGDQGVLMAIDAGGRVRWERALEDRYQFGGVEYGPAWFPVDIAVYRHAGAVRIAVAYHHHTWWPGLVVTFDAAGKPLSRFVNAGWLMNLNVSRDSRYLLAAGLSNDFSGTALAVLDAADPSGVSPGGGSLPSCTNCPPARPVAYYVTPWTELGRPSDTPPSLATVMPNGLIEWRAVQRAAEGGKVPEAIVTLSPDLEVVDRSVNDFYRELRPAAAGWKPPVRQWTAAHGWR